jgi:hypothetical protein
VKGTDTISFVKNKVLSDKWASTIDEICESRDKKKQYLKNVILKEK